MRRGCQERADRPGRAAGPRPITAGGQRDHIGLTQVTCESCAPDQPERELEAEDAHCAGQEVTRKSPGHQDRAAAATIIPRVASSTAATRSDLAPIFGPRGHVHGALTHGAIPRPNPAAVAWRPRQAQPRGTRGTNREAPYPGERRNGWLGRRSSAEDIGLGGDRRRGPLSTVTSSKLATVYSWL